MRPARHSRQYSEVDFLHLRDCRGNLIDMVRLLLTSILDARHQLFHVSRLFRDSFDGRYHLVNFELPPSPF